MTVSFTACIYSSLKSHSLWFNWDHSFFPPQKIGSILIWSVKFFLFCWHDVIRTELFSKGAFAFWSLLLICDSPENAKLVKKFTILVVQTLFLPNYSLDFSHKSFDSKLCTRKGNFDWIFNTADPSILSWWSDISESVHRTWFFCVIRLTFLRNHKLDNFHPVPNKKSMLVKIGRNCFSFLSLHPNLVCRKI